jgi:predicted DNA-binding transcriptional regulator AlpA
MSSDVNKLSTLPKPISGDTSGHAKPVAGPDPLLISAKTAAPMCGRSEASWWRDHAAARIPRPVRLGGRTLWRVEDLRLWVSLGCPDRRTFETMKESKRNG